jgi:hypothetical protein
VWHVKEPLLLKAIGDKHMSKFVKGIVESCLIAEKLLSSYYLVIPTNQTTTIKH